MTNNSINTTIVVYLIIYGYFSYLANQEQSRSSGKSKTGRNTRSAKQTSDTERLEASR